MDRIKLSKVEDVRLLRRGQSVTGVLHISAHHLIFTETLRADDGSRASENGREPSRRPREIWITYPMISYCTYRPASPASVQPASIRLRCRDFTFVNFLFSHRSDSRNVFLSIKTLCCDMGSVDKLYAFSYTPRSPEKDVNGWLVYKPEEEWARIGVGKGPNAGWRVSRINVDYKFSPTYPALLPVPASISDNVLKYAGQYRSRARIPVLSYLHPVNNCTITRSSQPMAGFRGNRSIQDERLVSAIFSSNLISNGNGDATTSSTSLTASGSDLSTSADANSYSSIDERSEGSLEDVEKKPKVYGSQQRNLIVDARPTVNAMAMQAVGLGSENMTNYKHATKAYLGIDNIHVMRDSLSRVIDALKDSDITPLPPNRDALAKSNWLKHISNLLDGADLIARQIAIEHSHVLIHCSDGWDRTSQLSSLAQICLDPYYRTLEGYIVLIEKDWLGFGHMFRHRAGYLSSEKWFSTQGDSGLGSNGEGSGFGRGSGGAKAIENAFLTAKGFFQKDAADKEENPSRDSDSSPSRSPNRAPVNEHEATKPKETSPVFHQFLDSTYQLLHQHPTRFEFNERFLRRLLYHAYSCQYGTFLYNNERERNEANVKERTRSVWDYFLCRKEQFVNEDYKSDDIDERVKGKESLLLPDTTQIRWWNEVFGRTDEEMNGKLKPLVPSSSIVTEVEPSAVSPDGSELATGSEAASAVSEQMASVSLGSFSEESPDQKRLLQARRKMELETQ